MANFGVLDYIIFVGLLAVSSMIGVYFWYQSRRNRTNAEFLTGNRQLGLFPVTMSMIASFLSTNTLLGHPAEVFQVGTQLSMQLISIVVAIVLATHLFMPIYYKMGLLSVNEYLDQRFKSEKMKLAGSLGFIVRTTPYMAVCLYGPALALSSVTPLSITTSILTVGVVCTMYTAIGGIKAVIWTDVLQCILMFLGLIIVIVQGVIELGGFGEIWRINEQGGRLKFFNFKVDLYNHDNFWNVFVGATIMWSSCYCNTQTEVQRYCSLGSQSKARKTLYWNIPGLTLLSLMAIVCGMVLFAKYHACDPITLGVIQRHDQLMPHFVAETLSRYPGLTGLFVACVFSGSLSTLSSGFNSLAAVTWEDWLKPRLNVKSEKTALNITKLIACSFGLLAISLSFVVGKLGTVMQASMVLSTSLGGPMFAMFLLGILFPYATSPGVLIGFCSGVGASMFVAIGSMLHPRPKVAMATSIDSCPKQLLLDMLGGSPPPPTKFIEYYHNVEGWAHLFHISYLIFTVIGFSVCLLVGIGASLCIGDWRSIYNRKYLSPVHKYLFPAFNTNNEEENDDKVNGNTICESNC